MLAGGRPALFYRISLAAFGIFSLLLTAVTVAGLRNYIYVYKYQEYLALPAAAGFGAAFLLAFVPGIVRIIREKGIRDLSLLMVLAGLVLILAYIPAKKILSYRHLA